jgi:UDP-N-acetylglucosamine 2-epimerase
VAQTKYISSLIQIKMNHNKNKIIYSLNIEDAQTVSEQEIGRELTAKEIEIIKDLVAEKIDWYEALADAIHQAIKA